MFQQTDTDAVPGVGQGRHTVVNGRDELARNRASMTVVDKRREGQHPLARLIGLTLGHASPATRQGAVNLSPSRPTSLEL